MASKTVPTGDNAAYFQAMNPGLHQYVDYTGSSAQSAKFEAQTSLIRLFSTTDCWVSIGTNPTASAPGTTATKGASFFLPGGICDYFGVPQGGTYRVAVIQDGTSGRLHITEGA